MARSQSIGRRPGDVFQVPLKDGSLGFGRVLNDPVYAFYDFRSSKPAPINDIILRPILFKIWVMKYAITKGRWPILGHVALEDDLQKPAYFFKQDLISKELFLYSEGLERPASPEECVRLERAAVWEPEHVEDRLLDLFEGRPNQWVEVVKLKLP
jgi:hypothetical protein